LAVELERRDPSASRHLPEMRAYLVAKPENIRKAEDRFDKALHDKDQLPSNKEMEGLKVEQEIVADIMLVQARNASVSEEMRARLVKRFLGEWEGTLAARRFLEYQREGLDDIPTPPPLSGGPRQVLIIRHAEKPDGDSVDLSPEGQKRAEALPRLFTKSPDRPDPFPTPDFIFATKKSGHSNRPVETVTPLAKALNLDIDSRFKDDEFDKLATELLTKARYAGKTVLVCWHHGTIPELARQLRVEDVPDPWKGSVFDRVWVITYGGGKTKLKDRPQGLMPGDEKE
jgi:broad specificity phosphatase PhoE